MSPIVRRPRDVAAQDEDCTVHFMPRIVDSKGADPASGSTVLPSQVLTYTLTFENIGTGTGPVDKVDDLTHVLDDATIVTEPTSSVDSLQVTRLSDTQYGISGTLEAGETATITYQVMVAAEPTGDLVIANFLLPPGVDPPTDPVCEEGDEDCTSHPVPDVTISKGADPASGTEVEAGDDITYTLTLANAGQAAGPVAFTDHLGEVLDDAELTSGPDSDTASVTATLDGETIVLDGSIEPGQTILVTYTVEVLAYSAHDDHMLGNFVTVTGDEPPTTCVDGSTLCTSHEVPPPAVPWLPRTGGELAIWLLVIAGLLTLGGAVLVIRRRRVEA